MKNVLICGSRSLGKTTKVRDTIEDILFNEYVVSSKDICILSGCAYGPDSVALDVAKEYNIKTKEFLANWAGLGKRAGYYRNKEMVKEADICIAIWDTKSKGTLHTIQLAKEKGIPITVRIL